MPETIPGVVSESGILPTAPATLEEIKRRRAIAAALASRQRPFPTTIGQGLTSLGEAFGDVMAERRLGEQERAYAGGRAADPLFRPPGSAPAAGAVAAPRPVAAVPAVEPGGDPRARIAALANPSDPTLRPAGVASPDPTLAGATEPPLTSPSSSATSLEAAATAGGDNPIWAARQSAIGGIESRGHRDPYAAVGAPTKYGRGLGRYQVVEANIAPWTQAALGQALTPQQYLASPQAQDAVFRHRFGQYVGQFGEEGAARAWFGGPGNVAKGDLTDVHKRLSIADYGKTYMEGLKASADPTRLAYASTGTATDVPPVGARGGMAIPPLVEENPETPSDVMPAPTRVAEARGVVPGAAPSMPPSRGAAPGAAPAGVAPALAGTRKPLGLPDAPSRAGEPLTDEELRGMAILRRYPGDEQAATQAKLLMEYGKARRDEAYARKVEEYKSRVSLDEKRILAEEEYTRNLPKTQQEFEEKQQKIQQAQEETRGFGYVGGRADAEKLLVESRKAVEHAPAAAYAVQQAAAMLNDKGMFTGTTANINLSWAKLVSALTGRPIDPAVINTEKFKPMLSDVLAQLRPAIAGTGAQSNAEFKRLEQAAAGDITLEAGSIKGILESIYKRNLRDAVQHQEKYDQYAQRLPEATRGMAAVTLGLPVERLVPPAKLEMFRRNLDSITDPAKRAAEIKEFESDYVPGLARMLGIR